KAVVGRLRDNQNRLALLQAPNPDHAVDRAGGGEKFGIRCEGQSGDAALLALQQRLPFSGGRIPQVNVMVAAAAGNPAIVGAEGDDLGEVSPFRLDNDPAGGGIPDLKLGAAAVADQPAAVGAEGQSGAAQARVAA